VRNTQRINKKNNPFFTSLLDGPEFIEGNTKRLQAKYNATGELNHMDRKKSSLNSVLRML
jgi:hypothetical protein